MLYTQRRRAADNLTPPPPKRSAVTASLKLGENSSARISVKYSSSFLTPRYSQWFLRHLLESGRRRPALIVDNYDAAKPSAEIARSGCGLGGMSVDRPPGRQAGTEQPASARRPATHLSEAWTPLGWNNSRWMADGWLASGVSTWREGQSTDLTTPGAGHPEPCMPGSAYSSPVVIRGAS